MGTANLSQEQEEEMKSWQRFEDLLQRMGPEGADLLQRYFPEQG